MSKKNGSRRKTHAVWEDENCSTSSASTIPEKIGTRIGSSQNVELDLFHVPSNIAMMAGGEGLVALEEKSRSSARKGNINRKKYSGLEDDDNIEEKITRSYSEEQGETHSNRSVNLQNYLSKDEGVNEDDFTHKWSEGGHEQQQKKFRKLVWPSRAETAKHNNGCWNKRIIILVSLFIVSLMAAVVAMGIVALKRNGISQSSEAEDGKVLSREYTLNQIIARISDSEALQTKGSPQYLAREWLIFANNLQLTPGANMTYTRISQRYALAVFYFSTGGEKSWSSNNWMWGEECEGLLAWEGISCTEDGHVRSLAFGE